jgi:hypothetical protein
VIPFLLTGKRLLSKSKVIHLSGKRSGMLNEKLNRAVDFFRRHLNLRSKGGAKAI